ncbi:MAG: Y-family DNA polymerase [Planctomycetota bacterium]|jgi:protein ImuB
MERWGCVDVPALPLQLLILCHPGWARCPVAVVDRDEPQGTILWVNEQARRNRVRVGHRYAEGLSLAAGLRAGVVDANEIQAQVDHLARRLRRFTPEVEPSADEPGVFWLNASGFERLFPSLEAWASGIRKELREAGFWAAVVVGFDRFNTYALSKLAAQTSTAQVCVLTSTVQERRRAGRVPLDRLHLEPKLRDSLERLGIETVADLRRLPAGGLLSRFGRESYLLHRLVDGTLPAPLAPAFETEPVCERFELEPEQHQIDVTALLFLLKQRLAVMQQVLAERGEAVAGLRLRLLLARGIAQHHQDHYIQPAAPTLDEVQLGDLLRRRIGAFELMAPVVGFELLARGVRATREQLQLFTEQPRRDLRAANRALARLRAELGEAAVVQAVLSEGHLPEAGFGWQPLSKITVARPAAKAHLRLVRRILARPELLACQRAVPDGWFVYGLGPGPVQALFGPYLVSGGWWRRPQHREYHFAETRRGDLLWIYFDRHRRSWFLHGMVE